MSNNQDKAREITSKHIQVYRTGELGIGDTVHNAVTEAIESQRKELDQLHDLVATQQRVVAKQGRELEEASAKALVYAAKYSDTVADYLLLKQQLEELREELERERIRLAACGVIALSNTADSAKQSREMHEDYWSASAQDVANAVDKQMELRELCGELASELRHLYDVFKMQNKFAADTCIEGLLAKAKERLNK